MKYSIIILLFFTIISCADKKIENDSFAPIEQQGIIYNNESDYNLIDDHFKFSHEIPLPDYVDQVYRLHSSNGTIYFNDKYSIYRYNFEDISTFFTPSKGRGPGEAEHLFRFDVLEGEFISIAAYPQKRTLIHDLKSDSTFVFSTRYDTDVLISSPSSLIGMHTSSPTGKMFQKVDLVGYDSLQFGEIFNNQYRSLDAFNLFVDRNDNLDMFVVGFLNAGYYTAFDFDGNMKFLSTSLRNGEFIPSYVEMDKFGFMDSQGITVTRSITMFGNEFHSFSAITVNQENQKTGSIIDVYNLENGRYKYSYKLNHIVDEIELVNDSTLVGITDDFTLAVWKKRKSTN